MRLKWKLWGRTILFFLIFLVITFYLSTIVIPKNNLDQFGMKDVSANGILSEKENTIDLLVLGDSEAYSSFSPMALYEQYGFTSYVCSTPAQPLYYTYSLLEQALQKQQPKAVVLETNAIFRGFLTTDPIVEQIKNWFPLFEYHDRWKSLKPEDFTGEVQYTYTNVLKGFKISKDIDPVDKPKTYMEHTDGQENLSWINRMVLDRIVRLCQERNIPILFYSSPSYKNWNMKKHNTIEGYCIENSIPFVDLNLEKQNVPIDWRQDTRDKGDHLNFQGAMKVTHYMGSYLKKNIDLPDHRNDPAYDRWKEWLVSYKKHIREAK